MPTFKLPARAASLLLGAALFTACGDSTAPPRATTVQVTATTVALDALGATRQLSAAVRDQNDEIMSGAVVTWASLTPTVATVDQTGLITAVTNGTAQVTATSGTATAMVAVTVAQVAVAPTALSGNGQSATIGTPLAMPLQARVHDRLGSPMAGQSVNFVVTSGSGSVGTPTSTTAADGIVSTTWTLGTNTSVPQLVSVSVTGASVFSTFTATALAGPATTFDFAPTAAGNGQSAPFGTAVPVPPAVKLSDALGNGVAGAAVTFSVTGGGGSITGGAATTNASGIATVGSWTLGPAVGPNTLQATVAGLPAVNFTATATLDPCSAGGAPSIVLGGTINGTLAATDCSANEATNYDLYSLELAAQTWVIIGMTASFDAYLKLFNAATGTLIAEHDDIVPGVVQDSRIVIQLPAGTYLIRARSFDPGQFGTYALSVVEAVPGVPTAITVTGGNSQVVAPGASVPIAPSVRVTDALGDPVNGAQVTFAIVPSVGAITGANATTNASGVATLGSWTLAAGANVLAATVASTETVLGSPAMFSANGNASTAGFNIDLKFKALPTLAQLQAFSAAAAKWESVLTNDLPAQPVVLSPGQCSGPGLNETVDDLLIFATLEPIDGPGQILGSAGPCALRSGATGLTVVGTMRFDIDDLAGLESSGRLNAVIMHEMGHVLGVGTLWNRTGLLLQPSLPSSAGVDTRFTGVNSVAGFDAIGGATYTGGGKVPVENSQGGAGTRDSHWRESVLVNELMTGFINAGTNPMSMLTVRSMQDLGYTVNTANADPFFLSLSIRAEGSGTPNGVEMVDDIYRGPVYILDSRGRIIGASLRQK